MSVEVMAMVFKKYPVGGGEMLLALALADHADDTGCRVFPSVAGLALKTRQSERSIQYQLRKMEAAGFLVLVSESRGGRYGTREYRIDLEYFSRGANIAPLKNEVKGCNLEHQGVQPEVSRGAIAVAPESSRTIIEPSKPSVESKSRPQQKITFDAEQNKFNIPMSCYPPWETTFPKLDLDVEIDKAELWLSANPKRRKKNYERFLVGWFSRAVENAKPRVFIKPQYQAPAT
jgi:hypothetical protein